MNDGFLIDKIKTIFGSTDIVVTMWILGITLFIINITIYLLTIKRIKHHRIWMSLSIVGLAIGGFGNMLYVLGRMVKTSVNGEEKAIMYMIINSVIQLIVLIKLVINIVKNRKKEEP